MKKNVGFDLPEMDAVISSDLPVEEKITQALQVLSTYHIFDRFVNLACLRVDDTQPLQALVDVDDSRLRSWTWPTVDPWNTELPWEDGDAEYGALEISDAIRMASQLGVDVIRFRSPYGELCIPVPLAEAGMDI